MRANEFLAELWTQPYELTSRVTGPANMEYYFNTKDNRPGRIVFDSFLDTDDGGLHVVLVIVHFYIDNLFHTSGKGDAVAIFSTVVAACRDYLRRYKPPVVSFETDDSKKRNLYVRMSGMFPDYVIYPYPQWGRDPVVGDSIFDSLMDGNAKDAVVLHRRNYDPEKTRMYIDEKGLAEGFSNEKANSWIEKVYDMFPQTWQNNHVMPLGGEGDDQQFAMFELVPSNSKRDAVEVKWFQAYPLRKGVGSRAMVELQKLAQEDGISLTLYPWDKGQVSQSKLMKFYKGQGFKPTVKGSKNMYWSPNDSDIKESFGPLSSMVNQDQVERNEYKNFVKSKANGDWNKGAEMYAQLKKRPTDDIFGDAERLNQFMKMKFNFDKFTDEDWNNYWLLAQHCDTNRNFQKQALAIIKKYQGEDNSHYKYLYDRISVGLTGKQKYGTQNINGQQGVAEGTADDINKMFGNMYDPMTTNLQRVALLAMQGRQNEAIMQLNRAIKDASSESQKKIIDAVNNIKPVTINGKVADSATLDKSPKHQEWILKTFIPWVQKTIGKQGVSEAFDQPYKLKWEKSEYGDIDALAKLPNGSPLSIMFNLADMSENDWGVEFYRNNSQSVTGEGDAQRVFATVLNAIGQFIKKKKPDTLFFTAVKEEDPTGSRTKLYDRLVQRYATELGYNLQKVEYPEQTGYKLTRKEQGMAEEQSSTPSIGINVRTDGDIDYASLIVDGKKKYESRKSDSLRPYVGKTVGIVRTGSGPAVAIGQVTIGEPIVVDIEKFNKLRKQHLVPQGSKFDIDVDGTKYLYPMINPVRWDNEKLIKHKGIVSRKIDQ